MIVMSATGGSGSSVVASVFKHNDGWGFCKRPDGGRQKADVDPYKLWCGRVKPFISIPKRELTEEERCNHTIISLQARQVFILSMTWGGLGYLRNFPRTRVIYLIRDPVFAFISYSGGGWRPKGGKRRISHVGAEGPNDRKWIDAWLGDFALWLDTAKHALESYEEGISYIVRYHKLRDDWAQIPDVPPAPKDFKCKDNTEKLKGFLTQETVDYIRERTNPVWSQISQLSL